MTRSHADPSKAASPGVLRRRSLSVRHTRQAVLVALFLGLVFSAAQIAVDLTREQEGSRAMLEQLLLTTRSSATQAAYRLDPVLGDQVVQGLLHSAPVYRAEIRDDFGDLLARAERPAGEDGESWLAREFFEELETHSISLAAREGSYPVGRLTIWSSPTVLAHGFLERAWLTLLAGVLRNLVLAAALAWIFTATLTRPLERLTSEVLALRGTQRDAPALSTPPGHEADEIGLLAGAFRDTLSSLAQTQQELRQLNTALEDRVAARTAQLDAANRELADSNARLATTNQELRHSISELERAHREIKTLEGFLPICMHCKKIRDDGGYWNQLECYITERSGAMFSHGICPECKAHHYPDLEPE